MLWRMGTMVEGILVKHRLICAAFAMLALTAPALAQGYAPPPGPPPAHGPGAMPPYEILSMLRSTGYEPMGQPVRRGPNYVLRAIDDRDREVSVVINARSGDILSVTPVQTASRVPPVPPGGSMGPYERMPPGYIPPGSYRPGPPVVDEDDGPPPQGYGPPRPPAGMPGAPPRSSNAVPPPRGGAMPPDDDDGQPPSSSNVITADPDQGGALPPPPERFPQRVAPPPPPKPVKRAAAAPPKQAPLPKPKPGGNAAAPQALPPLPDKTPAPAKAPAPEETPN
jgi:hypothetical protein